LPAPAYIARLFFLAIATTASFARTRTRRRGVSPRVSMCEREKRGRMPRLLFSFHVACIKLATDTVDIFHMSPISSQVDFLARLLDVTSLRHEVIAQNVANVNTPGFRRQDVQFEEFLSAALGAGKDAAQATPKVVTDMAAVARNDGNSVDIDMEMGTLTKNSLLYKTYAQILVVQLAQMRSAISGR
jgi:flagellar basal-body rod protein FlgB